MERPIETTVATLCGGRSGDDGAASDEDAEIETAEDLTCRERAVLTALCRPSLQSDAFVNPASAREIAEELVVTEAAVKQHLLRLYAKFGMPEGGDRRVRLANEVVRAGFIRPAPPRP